MNPQENMSAPLPTSSSVPQSPVSSASLKKIDGLGVLSKFAWNTFTNHWKMFVSILIVPIALYVIGVLLFMGGTVMSNPGMIVGSFLGFIIMLAAYAFFIAAWPGTINALHKISTDSSAKISVKEQYRFGFSVFWSTLLVFLIGGFVNQGATMLLVIPGIFVMISTIFYMHTLVIDGKRNFAALTESYSLVKGRWWGVFGRLLILLLIMAGVYIVAMAVGSLSSLLPGIFDVIIPIIISIPLFAFMWTFANSYVYRLYITLKATRTAQVSTSTFKGWLIAFLCIGAILVPIAIIGILSSVVLTSLNVARMKGLEAQRNAESAMMDIQRQIDAENLEMMQQVQDQQSVPR